MVEVYAKSEWRRLPDLVVDKEDYDALNRQLLEAQRWRRYAWHLPDCPNNDGVSPCLCGFSDLIPLPPSDNEEELPLPELGSAHEQVDCPDPATCVLCNTQRDL
jgi:hypothetical protein